MPEEKVDIHRLAVVVSICLWQAMVGPVDNLVHGEPSLGYWRSPEQQWLGESFGSQGRTGCKYFAVGGSRD